MFMKKIASPLIMLIICSAGIGASPLRADPSPNDVTSVVEYVGNPSKGPYFSINLTYARNVWDMQVFDDRLYIGSGNSNNSPPTPNAGPVNVWSYNAVTNRFVSEYVVNEEQIDQFEVIDGTLYIPGHDALDSWQFGNFYRLDNGHWVKIRTIPGAIHVYDLYEYHNRLYAALGVDDLLGDVVAYSDDNGQTWTRMTLPAANTDDIVYPSDRAWKFFEVNGDLFVSQKIPVRQVPLQPGVLPGDNLGPAASSVQELTATGFVNTDINFFAPFPANKVANRVVRPVQFKGSTVYLGATVVTDHQWDAFGLFSIDANHQVTNYPLEPKMMPWDLLVENGTLYALMAQPQPNGRVTVSVRATCDLVNWREVLRFNALTFARSFELYRGDFYFGMGTETKPIMEGAGNILRVNHSRYDANC